MTTFHSGIDASRSDGIRLTGTRFRFEGPVSATSGGGMTIWNSGLVEITTDADFVLDGPFSQRGAGPVLTAGDITTTGDSILFQGPVRLADGAHVTLNTTAMGGSGADIRFAGTLNGQTAGTAALTLSAGGGDVRFERVVGQSQRLGTMTVVDAHNVLIAAALHADSLTQIRGSGTTLIDGPTTLYGTAGINLATDNIVQNALIDVASSGAGAAIRLTAAGDVRLNAEERGRATALYRGLCAGRAVLAAGEHDAAALTKLVEETLVRAGAVVEYVAVVDLDTFEPVARVERPALVAVAGWVGATRLIDNLEVAP